MAKELGFRNAARTGRPGRPRLTQTQRIFNAIRRGAKDPKEIARRARVPLAHIHPIVARLRARNLVVGGAGEWTVPPTVQEELEGKEI